MKQANHLKYSKVNGKTTHFLTIVFAKRQYEDPHLNSSLNYLTCYSTRSPCHCWLACTHVCPHSITLAPQSSKSPTQG